MRLVEDETHIESHYMGYRSVGNNVSVPVWNHVENQVWREGNFQTTLVLGMVRQTVGLVMEEERRRSS